MKVNTENVSKDVFELCSPIAAEPVPDQDQPGVWSLSGRGAGYTGAKKADLACLVLRKVGESGDYQGEEIYPISAVLQTEPRLSRSIRKLEFRATKTLDGKDGLLYRKLPYANSRPNPWISSAENAVLSSVKQWGQFTTDHTAEAYRFEPLPDPPEPPEELPKVKELMGSLLADYVIHSMDHPVIRKLLQPSDAGADSHNDQGDDENVY